MKLLSPFVACLLALCCVYGATHAYFQRQAAVERFAATTTVPRSVVKTTALDLADYQALQKRTPAYGSVRVVAAAQNIQVEADALSDYAAWRLTVDRVLLGSPGVTWTVSNLCAGKCPVDDGFRITLSGVRRIVGP